MASRTRVARQGAAMRELTAAVQRLTMSRERLRLALDPPATPSRAAGHGADAADAGPARNGRDAGVAGNAADGAGLRHLLGHGALRALWRGWWRTNPLHGLGHLLAEAGDAAMAPLALRHPFALVATALVAGAAVVALRPWRWTLLPGLLVGLLPRVVPRLLNHAAPAAGPASPWLALLDALLPAAAAPRPGADARPRGTAA